MGNALSFYLEQKAQWRLEKAKRHPEDWRNQKAAERLSELAAEETDDDFVFAVIDDMETDVDSPYFDQINEARSEVLRSIGFGYEPVDVKDVGLSIVRSLREYPTIEDLARINKARGARDAAATDDGKTAN